MSRPTTGIIARDMVLPGILAIPVIEFETAFAAIDTVPSEETRLERISFPIWNIEFSIPEGMPIPSILFTICFSGLRSLRYLTERSPPCLLRRSETKLEATTRPMRVASAAPITSIWKT